MDILVHIVILVLSFLAFAYGCAHFIAKKKALYTWLITLGIGCTMMKTFFELLQILATGSLPLRFHVGMLGAVGTFLFFFSANYGVMDSLADDGSRQFLKYRMLGIISPLVLFLLYMPSFMQDIRIDLKIAQLVILCLILPASYYHLKHLVFPDVDFGVIRCIRGYNFLALLFAACSVINMDAVAFGISWLYYITEIGGGIILLLILPVLKSEVKKWTI